MSPARSLALPAYFGARGERKIRLPNKRQGEKKGGKKVLFLFSGVHSVKILTCIYLTGKSDPFDGAGDK